MRDEVFLALPVAVRGVEPVYPLPYAQVEGLLEFSVHALVVAPDELVAPCPRPEPCAPQNGVITRDASGGLFFAVLSEA